MRAGKFTILLVEDDQDQVRFAQRAFAKVGGPQAPRLEICQDGVEAIAYLAGEGPYSDRSNHPLPSLVLLDLKLPRKGGLDVLVWIRRDPHVRSMPVIILTSSNVPSDVERAYALGVNGYLVKPLELNGLLLIARAILDFWAQFNELPPSLSEPRS